MAYLTLEEKLEEVKHRRLDLGADGEVEDPDPNRPEISLFTTFSECGQPQVSISVGPLWGQQSRFIDMTLVEALTLASHIKGMVDAIESVVSNHEPPDPPGFEGGFAANH